jgi:hypothetical protein
MSARNKPATPDSRYPEKATSHVGIVNQAARAARPKKFSSSVAQST